jgi:hypothetical protein
MYISGGPKSNQRQVSISQEKQGPPRQSKHSRRMQVLLPLDFQTMEFGSYRQATQTILDTHPKEENETIPKGK